MPLPTIAVTPGTGATVNTLPNAGQQVMAESLPVVIASDQSAVPVGVASTGYTSQPTVTRPANTTAYAAGDVVGGAITFANAGPSGGQVVITDADLRIDVSAIPSGMASFRLHLYDVTPPSALADNAAWSLPAGDRASYLGYVDLGTPLAFGATLYTQATAANRKVKLGASTSLFGYLVTAAAYTPANNSEVYAPRLQTVGV